MSDELINEHPDPHHVDYTINILLRILHHITVHLPTPLSTIHETIRVISLMILG